MSLAYVYDEEEVKSHLDFEGYYRITNLPDPTEDDEPVTKAYADTHYSGGGGSGDEGLFKTGYTMEGDIHMAGYNITGLNDPTTADEPVTKNYVDTHYATKSTATILSDTGFMMKGDINMDGNRVKNIPAPSDNSDPATKKYVDDNRGITTHGFTMQDNISTGGHHITNLGTPTTRDETVNKEYADTHYITFSSLAQGFQMQNPIDMNSNKIENPPDPTSDDEPVTKGGMLTHTIVVVALGCQILILQWLVILI